MKQFGIYLSAVLLGFFLYAMFEIGERGYTHWTMALTGGVTMAVLYSMDERLTVSLPEKAFFGAFIMNQISADIQQEKRRYYA